MLSQLLVDLLSIAVILMFTDNGLAFVCEHLGLKDSINILLLNLEKIPLFTANRNIGWVQNIKTSCTRAWFAKARCQLSWNFSFLSSGKAAASCLMLHWNCSTGV